MVSLGVGILALMLLWVFVLFHRSEKKGEWPSYGVVGLIIILVSEYLLWGRVKFVLLYFTPLVWSGYILLVDAVVFRLTRRSRIHDSIGSFFWLALWSIPLWLIFEGYNLHLKNWVYLDLPSNFFLRYFGYAWSFATIWPALFETTDLVKALRIFRVLQEQNAAEPSRSSLWASATVGWAMLVTPLMLPQPTAAYLFGLVWLGMIFALDPINYWLRGHSLWREWVRRDRGQIYSMLLAGWFCGFLWEFWNYWAVARWVYIFPIMQNFKIFEMPLPGYLGFPPFCVECFIMFELVNPSRSES